jgi:subtilisin-like proprotein convertase family protein
VNDPTADTGDDTQNTTTVVDLGGGKLVAAWIDSLAGLHIGYGYSSDNGQTWTDAGKVNPADAGASPVLAHHKASGAVYLAALKVVGFHNQIKVHKSADDGHTFSPGVDATGGSGTHSRPWLTVDNVAGTGDGNVYLCWTNYSNGDIRFVRSTDGGASFGPVLGTPISAGGHFCFVLVGPNHQVYVFYYRGTGPLGVGGDNKLFMRRSLDRGVSFEAEKQIADLNTTSNHGDLGLNGGFYAFSYPHAAVDPTTGRLYVVYNDDPDLADPSDNGDIFLVRSSNGGTTWTAPIRVNDNADLAGDQFSPTIAFSPTGGRTMISWYSRSHDTDNHMFHRRGRLGQANANGAIQFKPSFQMGPDTPVIVGQDPAVGDPRNMGFYDQIAAGSAAFSTTWSDSRLGNALHRRQPDVRFARIAATPSVADLSISLIEVLHDPIALGELAVIRLMVSATGGTATDVFVSMAPLFGLTTMSATGGCTVIMGFVGCRLGNIADGQQKLVNIVVAGVHKAGTRVARIYATASSSDPTPSNNSVNATVTVTTNPAVQQQVFSTGNISIPIPDGGTVEVPIDIPVEGRPTNMVPGIRISHPRAEDLDISLVAPNGANGDRIALVTGGSGSGFGSGATTCAGDLTQFADYRGEVPPIAIEKGIVKPEQRIGTLLGGEIMGTWKLRITDRAAQGDAGTLHCFRLKTNRLE